ncbi:hypothetical protein [Leucobacter chromiireducens]|uniref:Uncharacterized protein n=1 Tax=Leucobacter chromiireducens subsp. solipictus TaxID=398235 RepID=A0ABS1SF41_9MICO|nr:hypothetical protein [Leucobacter chromiireducens]MBL3679170.1 hypothetical protein [Leucobacter chromiireducens subsp. solipictus]
MNTLALARQALRLWGPRQILVALAAALGFALLLGIATVLIPNPWFSREIATVWWNYPVWILTSLGAGMLTATYLRAPGAEAAAEADTPEARRGARWGLAGGVLSWFAVGCPVCNKLALLALGYSGAITWFAPVQPVLALAGMVLTGAALLWRLRGQVSCPITPAGAVPAVAERVELT